MIIGCGRIAGQANDTGMILSHAAAYHSNDAVDLQICMDILPAKADQFANQYGCRAVSDIDEGLSLGRPDIISVCSPDDTHFKITRNLLQSGYKPKVIFLEKPACSDDTEYLELLKLISRTNTTIIVNHSRRFDQHHIQLRERIQSGEFGNFYKGFTRYYSGWKHNGVHIVDTLSFLLNDDLRVKNVYETQPSPYEGDSTLDLKLEFAELSGEVDVRGVDEAHYQIFELDLLFSKYRLRIEDFGQKIKLEKKVVNQIGENVLIDVENGLTPKTKSSMQNALDLIVRFIQDGDEQLLDGMRLKDVHSTMRTIWEAQNEA